MTNGINKFGEKVSLQGPVCGNCHQRIVMPFANKTSEENICSHCYADELLLKSTRKSYTAPVVQS